MSRQELTEALYATVERNGMHTDVHVRLMISRGTKSTPSQHPSNLVSGPTVVIIAEHKRPDPEVYRRYLQRSLGEFSSAKASYVRLRTGWLSDRTASYLASGKPAIVLKTGPSTIFTDADGILRFTDFTSAERMLKDVTKRYDHHCRAARQIAEAHLDARKVLKRVLEIAVES